MKKDREAESNHIDNPKRQDILVQRRSGRTKNLDPIVDLVFWRASTACRVIRLPAKYLDIKAVGKTLGDTPIDLLNAGSPQGPVTTEFRVDNGGDTYRHCSVFDPQTPGVTVAWKDIAGGTGRKLVARNGQPSACP